MQVKLLAAFIAALLLGLGGILLAWALRVDTHPLLPLISLGVFLVLLALLLAAYRWLIKPLLALQREMARIAAGEAPVRAGKKGVREMRDLAAGFNRMAERLEERRREQLRFISNVVHDLRNPLHSITMASELLELKNDANGELVQAIFRQVANLDALLAELLDLSRIQAGELDLQLSRQDMAVLLREAVERNRKGDELHHFVVETRAESLPCVMDARRMSHVLNSLLSNAVKYSPQGGQIKVAAWQEKGRIAVSVSDQGVGIAREEQENIFKPFYRLKLPGMSIPGKGLGLSTSRRVIEAHQGCLAVESRPGQGSTFHLSFPASLPRGVEAGIHEGSEYSGVKVP